MANEHIQIQIKRGTDVNRRAASMANGEPGVTTNSDHLGGFLTIGDGSTVGGVYPGAGNSQPGWKRNSWYFTDMNIGPLVAATTSANVLTYMPICIPAGGSMELKNIGINVTTAGAAGAKVRVGLYSSSDGEPGDLVLDSGDLIATSTGFKSVGSALSVPLRPGWYWAAIVCNDLTIGFSSLNYNYFRQIIGWTSSAVMNPTVVYEIHVYAALPASATPLGLASSVAPIVHLQAK